ncbi:MAG: hypothetical protein HZB14_07880 [Actinobacteria bacterium]|nr:hypothetical protein [Actinomycetota bacterium]
MSVKELRPSLDPETCAVCGRRLLQGETVNWYVAPDSSRRPVCELCVPRAERARWMRERDGEPIVPLRPTRAARGGVIKRIGDFFGARDHDDLELETFELSPEPDEDRSPRRRGRVARRDAAPAHEPVAPPEPREVRAVPTGPAAQLAQGLELFNESQFPRIIAGLSRSLGDPQVAAVNDNAGNVDIYVGWDIAWYSYRVDLGDAGDPVEQSGRGNDTVELTGKVTDWNARADDYGRLFLVADAEGPSAGTPAGDSPIDNGPGDDRPAVYGGS